MRKTSGPFTSIFLIMLLLTGAIPTLTSIPLLDTEAFAEKKGPKHDSEKDDEEKDYQQKYKHYDFKKYLSHQYEAYKDYTQYYGDLLYSVENPDKNPFFTDEDVREQDDNRKEKQSDRDDDDDDDGANGKSDKMDSSEKNEKKTYKYIKIIECSNLKINQYDVEDLSDVEKIINAKEAQDSRNVEKIVKEVTISENNNNDDDDDGDNHVKESHIKNNEAAHQEYNIGSETKIIFLCNNDNLNMDSSNVGNDMMRNSLPSEGIMLPINSLKNNNNNNNDNEVTTTIS